MDEESCIQARIGELRLLTMKFSLAFARHTVQLTCSDYSSRWRSLCAGELHDP